MLLIHPSIYLVSIFHHILLGISQSKFNTLFCYGGPTVITRKIQIIDVFSHEMICMNKCHWFSTSQTIWLNNTPFHWLHLNEKPTGPAPNENMTLVLDTIGPVDLLKLLLPDKL